MLRDRLRRLLRLGHATAPAAAAAEDAEPTEAAIEVLLVSADLQLTDCLTRIAAAEGWQLTAAASATAGLGSLPARDGVVAIVDRDLPRADWREDLPRLAARPEVAAVLLASAVADDYLWQEVSRYQGHDVLPKPLRAEEVVRAVRFARSWGSAISGRSPL